MHRQIRATVLILCLLSAAVVLTACGKQEEPTTEQLALETVKYSNLTDEDSRKQLSELLTDAGIEESRIAALLNRVEQFNASVKSEWLTDGFESAAPTDTKYDSYEMHGRRQMVAFPVITAASQPLDCSANLLQQGPTSRKRRARTRSLPI